ncbi:hypothetical protein PQX77_018346, partial [Marasmius sp. AFHP31]
MVIVSNGLDLGCIIAIGIGDATNLSLARKAFWIDHGSVVAIAFSQLILALMTGGRIWWITRQVHQLVPGRPPNKRQMAIVSI